MAVYKYHPGERDYKYDVVWFKKIGSVIIVFSLQFPERVSSASQMKEANVMDVTARLLECAREAVDLISACTLKNKWRMLQSCSEFRSQNVQIFGYVFHDTSGHNLGQTFLVQWLLLNETFSDILLQGSCGTHFAEVL